MIKPASKKGKGKWILLISIAVIAVSSFLYLRIRKSNDFEPQIKAKLAKVVAEASNGLYKLDVGHLVIDITTSSITARNVLLVPDSARLLELEKAHLLGNNTYTIFLKKIDFAGVSPLMLLEKKDFSLESLVLDSPEVKIIHKKREFVNKDTGTFYQKISPGQQSFSIGSLLLKNIKLTINDLDKNKSISSFENLSAAFTDIKIDSTTINDSTRFLFAKDVVIFMKGFNRVTGKNKYRFNVDSLSLRPQNGSIEFFNIHLKPIGTKDEFSAKLTYKEDRYDFNIKKATVKNVNWFSLLTEDGFYGDEIILDGGSVNIYDDRRVPGNPNKIGKFPHQLLMTVEFPVSVKKLRLTNLFLSYEEFNPKSEHTGTVEFNHLNGEINNVTNIASEIAINPIAAINATADFMNTGKLNAAFKFDLSKAKNGNFTVDASLAGMDGQNLNKITEGLALLKIKSLLVDKLTVHMKGTNIGSTGSVTFAYHDLSFDVLKNNDEGELKKRGLLSLIANKVIINNSNPKKPGETPKQFAVSYQRDPQRSFFNLIWKTILDGILKTVK